MLPALPLIRTCPTLNRSPTLIEMLEETSHERCAMQILLRLDTTVKVHQLIGALRGFLLPCPRVRRYDKNAVSFLSLPVSGVDLRRNILRATLRDKTRPPRVRSDKGEFLATERNARSRGDTRDLLTSFVEERWRRYALLSRANNLALLPSRAPICSTSLSRSNPLRPLPPRPLYFRMANARRTRLSIISMRSLRDKFGR